MLIVKDVDVCSMRLLDVHIPDRSWLAVLRHIEDDTKLLAVEGNVVYFGNAHKAGRDTERSWFNTTSAARESAAAQLHELVETGWEMAAAAVEHRGQLSSRIWNAPTLLEIATQDAIHATGITLADELVVAFQPPSPLMAQLPRELKQQIGHPWTNRRCNGVVSYNISHSSLDALRSVSPVVAVIGYAMDQQAVWAGRVVGEVATSLQPGMTTRQAVQAAIAVTAP